MTSIGPKDKVVLVIEDDPELREALLGALISSGYGAVADGDALRALARLRAGEMRPRLVLLDLHLPGMSGLDFLQAVRGDPDLAGTPVAVMSAHQRLRAAAQPMHPVATLQKPVPLDALLEVVARCVDDP